MVAHIIVVQCISTPNSQGCSVFAAKFPDVSLLKNSKIQILLTFYCICKILSCTIAVCTAVKIVIQLIGIGSTLVSKELNHLAAILHVYARDLNFMK